MTAAEDKRAVRRVQLAQKVLQTAQRSGWEKGYHLTEASLSEILGVSRSPARAALELLQQWGAVIKKPNHGFYLDRNANQLTDIDADLPLTQDESLYIALINARLDRSIGNTITQAEVMIRFGSPRNVVDRAFSKMMEDGLLQQNAGRGWQFLPTFDSSRSWRDGYQLRLLLEPGGILLEQFSVDTGKLADTRRAHENLLAHMTKGHKPASWICDLDADFHELIASFTNNAFFVQAIQTQNRLRRLFELRSYGDRARIDQWCREHLEIVSHLEAGDVQKASRAMRLHLTNATASASVD